MRTHDVKRRIGICNRFLSAFIAPNFEFVFRLSDTGELVSSTVVILHLHYWNVGTIMTTDDDTPTAATLGGSLLLLLQMLVEHRRNVDGRRICRQLVCWRRNLWWKKVTWTTSTTKTTLMLKMMWKMKKWINPMFPSPLRYGLDRFLRRTHHRELLGPGSRTSNAFRSLTGVGKW